MKKLAILMLAIAAAMASCQTDRKDQVVTVKNKYTISLPPFVKESSGLNDDASLQYQNSLREFYVVVIDESKSEFEKALSDNDLNDLYPKNIKGYSELLMFGMEQAIEIKSKSMLRDTVINNQPARLQTIKGRVEGTDIFYSIGFIQGVKRYYQVIAWTLQNKEKEHAGVMKKIIASFKEV